MSTDTTYIAGGLFEVVASSTGTTEYRHNIVADGEVIAVHTITQSGNAYTDYLHYDHLGSVDAITDDSGNVIQSMSFDAFGQRRDAANWDYDLSQNTLATLKNYTDRGYTDQEQLDNLSLVDLNGRVYDPTVGRMISADPTVPAPLFSQAFNRFAYVYDSPLVNVDPTGLGSDPCQGKIVEAINVGGSSTRAQGDACPLGPVTVTATPVPPPSLNSTNTTNTPGNGPQSGANNGPDPGKNPNNNPKPPPKPAQPCLKGQAVSAKKTGVDQVQYTDAAGNTETLSGGSRSWVANNPANVEAGKGSIGSYAAMGQTTMIFPDYSTGQAAQNAIWGESKYQNKTILGALNLWAFGPNPPPSTTLFTAQSSYVQTVVDAISGVTAGTLVNSLTATQQQARDLGQQAAETWKTGQTTCGG